MILGLALLAGFVGNASADEAARGARRPDGPRRIVFYAGKPSHGYGAHEHYAGSMLLANSLKDGTDGVEVTVVRTDWPSEEQLVDADCLVVYTDGGGGHPINSKLEQVQPHIDRGMGLVCLHYGVEVPKGKPGEHLLKWIGGYFETDWSVNPHWDAKFTTFPDHPITRGVEPFQARDEWYYHMRFADGMKGVTPILTDLPGDETLRRPDGPHSGNPAVRAAIAQKTPQHLAWAYEREDGGRGFGFTGGHFHWNWGNPNFRRLVLNAVLWTSGGEVPEGGVGTKPVTVDTLQENQDYKAPDNFDPNRIKQDFQLGDASRTGRPARTTQVIADIKPLFTSPIVSAKTPGHAVEIDVELGGAKALTLVVEDAGDGYSCDWAAWVKPRVVTADGTVDLTQTNWKKATSQWGKVRVGKNCEGGPVRVAGEDPGPAIGTHANSVIVFDLPKGAKRFQARGAADDAGVKQNDGQMTSVRFLIYGEELSEAQIASIGSSESVTSREPLAGLSVGDGLQAEVFAAEPDFSNPTNIDIDHRGRIWVCEVINYRNFRNTDSATREAGDRILVMEDTTGDGQADKTHVFYQGRDIDSAHGVCVIGHPGGVGQDVIVSAGSTVHVFTDADGDLVPESRRVLFTGISGVDHDHGIHSVLMGPDGRLYFNFGNEGRQIKDARGQAIVDRAGNVVAAVRNPYQEGMAFRCEPDGSHFETLGWNFRNNWELTVDSFGTIWQSDNDDDGNRGVRINYVMEYGNYGYKDEMTGAGWREPRTNIEAEIPDRHWHLNDPGVVPNLLATGAGSPTGIAVYEGTLLPKRFHGSLLHCDAGPNIVRAYVTKADGAGYSATTENILVGTGDKWFRPSDVCVATDGSLIVADWYDPGVGGHRMQDVQRGRLYRVTPAGHEGYKPPKYDFFTIEGAIAAFQSPNISARATAFATLQAKGDLIVPAVKALVEGDADPRLRARAIWLLGSLDGHATEAVGLALADDNTDVQGVGIRLARRANLDLVPMFAMLTGIAGGKGDNASRTLDPVILREIAIGLREVSDQNAVAALWANLAQRYVEADGGDRWMLEALGIAAHGRWDACLDAYQAQRDVADPADVSAAERDLLWRSRGRQTPNRLATLLTSPQTPEVELPRLMRAMDFQIEPERTDALLALAFGPDVDGNRGQFLVRESLSRLSPAAVASMRGPLLEKVEAARGTGLFTELVDRFGLTQFDDDLVRLAVDHPTEGLGVTAATSLLRRGRTETLAVALRSDDPKHSAALAEAIANTRDERAAGLLMAVIRDVRADRETQRRAAAGVAGLNRGGNDILALVRAGQLESSLVAAVTPVLQSHPNEAIRKAALSLFPPPPSKDARPLPPIAELAKRKGNAETGKTIFENAGTCAKCHQVGQSGKSVGPDLTEIGDKLSRTALYEAILYPSAGISHNYETYLVAMADGTVGKGLLISRSPTEVVLRGDDGIDRAFPLDQVEDERVSPVSLMPADLQKLMTHQELIDVVEYMTTLKKK